MFIFYNKMRYLTNWIILGTNIKKKLLHDHKVCECDFYPNPIKFQYCVSSKNISFCSIRFDVNNLSTSFVVIYT